MSVHGRTMAELLVVISMLLEWDFRCFCICSPYICEESVHFFGRAPDRQTKHLNRIGEECLYQDSWQQQLWAAVSFFGVHSTVVLSQVIPQIKSHLIKGVASSSSAFSLSSLS